LRFCEIPDKKYNHAMRIHLLAFVLFLQCLVACQQAPENSTTLTASLAAPSNASCNTAPAPSETTNAIFRSTDGGLTWQDVSAGLPSNQPIECFSLQQGEIFLGNAEGLYHRPIHATTNLWEQEFLLNEQVADVFSGRSGLYARSAQNDFFQKVSNGIWTPVFADLKNQYFRTFFEAANGDFFMGTDKGILKSTDQGTTWNHVYDKSWMIQMVESHGVLLCTNEHGILRSTDGGEHWEVVISEGGVGIAVEVIEGGFAAITYNTSSETRRIRISNDGGKTWQPIDAGLPPHANIASITQVGPYFLCGHPRGIYRSADGGKTWQLILPSIGEKVFNLSVSGQVIYAVPLNAGC
jgi:photosystem II stability/assembly factor-like uncharacterized protein